MQSLSLVLRLRQLMRKLAVRPSTLLSEKNNGSGTIILKRNRHARARGHPGCSRKELDSRFHGNDDRREKGSGAVILSASTLELNGRLNSIVSGVNFRSGRNVVR